MHASFDKLRTSGATRISIERALTAIKKEVPAKNASTSF
jgi:hypothetical protein